MSESDGYSVDDDNQLTQEDMLIDRGVDDLLDEGYEPPDAWREPRDHETLDELLAEEEPDTPLQAPERRAGRLVGGPQDGELLGREVGIDGGAASAEEAAVHVIDE